MKQTIRVKLPALLLALTLLLMPAAHALTLEQTRELISTYYISQVPEAVLSQPTIADTLSALGDPYAQYFSPQEYLEFQSSLQDTELVGLGLSYLLTERGMLVSKVYNGGAAQAGLMAGDLITEVGGTPLAGLAEDALVALLQGEVGTTIIITYLREEVAHTVTITRRPYVVTVGDYTLVDGSIGYISSAAFGEDTYGYFTSAMTEYQGQTDRWVADLRSNGGGEVYAALQVTSAFIGQEPATYMRDSTDQISLYAAQEDALTEQPVIVLTNGRSASASELFAGAIRDHNAGIIVGERSYGKGVAQDMFDQTSHPAYFADGDALKITTARFYSPSGATNDTVGIIPHFLLDADLAPHVARLLSPTAPTGDTGHMLRIDKGFQFYVNLDQALTPELRGAFIALLEAVPPNTRLLEGTGQGWAETTAAAVAQKYQLTEYQPRGFSDSDDSQYGVYLDILATYGILHGIGDGSYHPTDTLTRGQLCALLAQALNCHPYEGQSHFSDVDRSDWYFSSIHALAAMGLVTGDQTGAFRPDEPVDNQQLFTILARVSRQLNLFFDLAAQEMPPTATDAPQLSSYADWARPGVWLLNDSQQGFFGNTITLLWLDAGEISPTAAATREQAGALLYNVLSYAGVLPA